MITMAMVMSPCCRRVLDCGNSLYDWETLFAGYRWDDESGLYQVRYRCFLPILGVWAQWDPLGFAAGINLYQYAVSNPINHTDIYGMDVLVLGAGGLFVVAGLLVIEVTVVLGVVAIVVFGVYVLVSSIVKNRCNQKLEDCKTLQEWARLNACLQSVLCNGQGGSLRLGQCIGKSRNNYIDYCEEQYKRCLRWLNLAGFPQVPVAGFPFEVGCNEYCIGA